MTKPPPPSLTWLLFMARIKVRFRVGAKARASVMLGLG